MKTNRRRPEQRPGALVTRDEFRLSVFERDRHRCVICQCPVQDAHHIMERRLFSDSGYYLDNGASLCQGCHLLAEQTVLSCEDIREAAGIRRIVLPDHLYDDARYDKWGNILLSDGRRVRGELFDDDSVRKILTAGGVLPLFTHLVKYPRTYHLPWSPGRKQKDERALPDVRNFEGRRVVCLEKMDGENFTIYQGEAHARSVDGQHRFYQDWVRRLQAAIGWELPSAWRMCGEYLYARHRIHYRDLPSYYMPFAIYDERNVCLGWDDTQAYAALLGLPTPQVLYSGPWDEVAIRGCYTSRSAFSDECEGYVVRLADEFPFSRFRHSVAKFVREGHVPMHGGLWSAGQLVTNELTQDPSELILPRNF